MNGCGNVVQKYFEKHPLRRIALRHPFYAYKLKKIQKGDFQSQMNFHKKVTLKFLRNKFKKDAFPPIRSASDLLSFLKSSPFFTFGYFSFLYITCRLLKPSAVVETGVGAGLSSTFILQALSDNRNGNLYSIDLPQAMYITKKGRKIDDSAWIPEKFKKSGWLVPQRLRNRWELLIGKSKETLLPLLRRLKCIDLFFHDSEHTYENMFWEYKAAWSCITKGGVLASHDVDWNDAFTDFSKTVNHKPVTIRNYAFILRKK